LTASPQTPSPEKIRAILDGSKRGPLKAKEIARALDLSPHAYRSLKGRLRAMEQEGQLYRLKGNRYAVPSKINLTVGTFQVTRGGDAFVRLESAKSSDVYVPARNHESAMDGDRVAVRIESRPRDRAPVGRVVKVLERSRPTIVGTFHANRSFGFVRPIERRLSRDILIPQGKGHDAAEGDVVIARISQYGDRRLNATGEVERVLGPIDDPGVDVLAILHGYGLPDTFPPEVEEAAREAEARVQEPGARTDRRSLHVFTIDPSDAKDHDDALSVVQTQDDAWEVGIHIADVSHFVEEGSVLDLEAFQRGTSVYLVDQVVPMLPHRLSSNLCSLVEGEDRLAVSVFLTVDTEGRVCAHRFERSWIRTARRLDYALAQQILDGESSVDPETDSALKTLDLLAKGLRNRRNARGSLDFDLPEARVILDDEGSPIDIRRSEQLASHRLIEDFMIATNEIVAREAERRKLPIPFRVHEPPAEDRREELEEFLKSIGHSLPKGKLRSASLQQVLERVGEAPEASLVSAVILRSMSRARYDPKNIGHFGLASRAYTHFTSPIRRYPDLALHRVVIRAIIEGKPPLQGWSGEGLSTMTAHASERERVAERAERDSIALKKIEFMLRHLGDEFDGGISGVTSFGFFVTLDKYFVEGLVHVSALGDDYYRFVPESYSLVGERRRRRFRLGDRVRVRVDRVNKEEREIDFTLLPEG